MHMCGISSNAFELNVHCDRGDSIVLVLSAPALWTHTVAVPKHTDSQSAAYADLYPNTSNSFTV